VARLADFSYGGITLVQIPQPVLIDGVYREGIEFSSDADCRDSYEGKFQMDVLPTNDVMLQMPALKRTDLYEHNQIFTPNFTVFPNEALQGVIDGHSVMRAAVARDPTLRIRIVVFIFPEYYKLSGEIFSKKNSLHVTKSGAMTTTQYRYKGFIIQNTHMRLSFVIARTTSDDGNQRLEEHKPDVDDDAENMENMNQSFQSSMNVPFHS
jgi:hypothetical protein